MLILPLLSFGNKTQLFLNPQLVADVSGETCASHSALNAAVGAPASVDEDEDELAEERASDVREEMREAAVS